jgi:dihydrofolate synthase/folylpolyglutamate synthase
MNYLETCDWLFNQLPMYQRSGKAAYKADLSNTIMLMDHLSNPQFDFKSVHVAGTNGKGSTSHMIASILQESGYKVGLYTSPHLTDFRERIKINGEMISEKFVVSFVAENKIFFEESQLSFFEMTVGLAFDYFREQKVDIAVVEVGLGGRLDSTNVLRPEVSVITNIDLDHTQFLGNTLSLIAKEKAGIIKSNTPVITGKYQKETASVFQDMADSLNAELIPAYSAIKSETFELDLLGEYQKENSQTARIVAECLADGITSSGETFSKIDLGSIKKGLKSVVVNTGLKGRWQLLSKKPVTICDTAHNSAGLAAVMSQLNKIESGELHLVIGIVNDKNLKSLIPLFPKNAKYYFCEANTKRALSVEVLKSSFAEENRWGKSYSSVLEAYATARMNAEENDVIYIGGSTFVVAEVL